MKKIILSVAALSIAATSIFVACKKDEVKKSVNTNSNGASLKITNYDAGQIHNDMLAHYKSDISTTGLQWFQGFNQSNYQQLFYSKLKPLTESYFTANYSSYAGTFAQLAQELIDSAQYLPQQYQSLVSNQSQDFQNFVNDISDLVNHQSNSSNFQVLVTDIENQYSSIITNEIELMAIENACATAIASNQYWSQNMNLWDQIFPIPVIPSGLSKGDIIYADMCGAIGGSLKGGLKGLGFGPGGATAGVLIGFVGGAALSSAAAYGHSKIQGWLGL